MKHRATRELFAYWNGLRGERTAPERSEIDPAAIRNVLADTFMLDVEASRRFPFRLAGTRVNALFDAEQKGRSFLDLWSADERRNTAAVLLTVADGATPVVMGAAGAPRGHEACAFELLLLPLRHFGKTHSRILGMITATVTPAWLGLLPLDPLSVQSMRIVEGASEVPARTWRPLDVGRLPMQVARCVSLHGDGLDGDLPPGLSVDETLMDECLGRPGKPRLRVIQGGVSTR